MSIASGESAMLQGKVRHLRIFEHQKLVLIGFPQKKRHKIGCIGKGVILGKQRRGLNMIKTHRNLSKN